MSYPLGKRITKQQEHELNYWLERRGFRETEKNRESLKSLINAAKVSLYMNSTEYLEYDEINSYFKKYKWLWESDFEKK